MVADVPEPTGAASDAAVLRRTGFLVRVEELEGTVIVFLRGELDLSTAPALRSALMTAMAGGATAIVLDAAELTFCDSTGISVFLAACRRAEKRRLGFCLRHPGPTVLKTLRLTGMDRVLNIET